MTYILYVNFCLCGCFLKIDWQVFFAYSGWHSLFAQTKKTAAEQARCCAANILLFIIQQFYRFYSAHSDDPQDSQSYTDNQE